MEKIAIIGIGRLGLCLALNLERSGYEVLGIDLSEEYVKSINNKTFHSAEPNVNEYLKSARNLTATTDIEKIFTGEIELIFIVIPTPSLPNGEFDHSGIDEVIDSLAGYAGQKKLRHLVICSTTMPGYCDSLQKKATRHNFTVSYNPEFIAQGSIIENQQCPDMVLIGETSQSTGNLIQEIYTKMCRNTPVFCRMSLISAEITKLATNCFLTTKISFANSVGDLAKKAGADPEKVLDAIGIDSRIGNKYLKYGFGYGGPCFPRDNRAFLNFASSHEYKMFISEATDKANESHGVFLFQEWAGKYSDEEYIFFDSVTYKKGTDILEESQQLKLALALARSGRKVVIRESAPVIKALNELYGNLFSYEIVTIP